MFGQKLGSRPGSGRGRMVKQVAKSSLPAPIVARKKCKHELLLGLVLFRLVAPPLQPRVVVLYLIWGVWFPSHLPLERTGHIQNFGP
jgi:hypothetical protein